MRIVPAVVAGALVVLPCSPLVPAALHWAQETETGQTALAVESGTRVRVTAPFVLQNRIEGFNGERRERHSPGQHLRGTGGSTPLENLQKLEVSTGHRDPMRAGEPSMAQPSAD